MLGMMQIVIWMLGFYFVLKGIEILQIARASTHEKRQKMIDFAVVVLVICVLAAIAFIVLGNMQAGASSPGVS